MKERIQKVLGSAGVASRRNIEQMIVEGRISVNGKAVRELPVFVDPGRDRVEVDGEEIRLGAGRAERRYYLLMNKPRGVYCTNVAQGEQLRAIDLLPPDFPGRVYPVGRLDAESRGLLLLTNDGELTNRLTHPRYGVPKTYRAVVDGRITPEEVQSLERGVWLADRGGEGGRTGRSHIRILHRARDKSILEISIREGRNRQVRRMLAKLGHKVRDLTRVRLGPLTLHNLPPGHVRALTPREVRLLQEAATPDPRPKSGRATGRLRVKGPEASGQR